MSEIVYQHYIGKGPEAEAIIAEANEKHAAFIAAADAFKEEHGFESLWQDWGGVGGPAFKKRLDNEAARTKGLKFHAYGNAGYAYSPSRGSTLGKSLKAALDELNKVRINRPKHVVKMLGMEHTVYSAGRLAHAVAGFKDGVIVVKVPTGNGDSQNDDMPIPPEWLVPCKESEALAALGQ